MTTSASIKTCPRCGSEMRYTDAADGTRVLACTSYFCRYTVKQIGGIVEHGEGAR